MPARQLILIEGMIGAGKSTTADRLAARLMDEGEGVSSFQEFADDHPIRTRRVDQLRNRSAPATAYDVRQWDTLADRCAAGGHSVIIESTFLQNSVMPHFIDAAPIAAVKEVFADIAARIAPAAPLLVYLRPSDIAAAIRRVHTTRGEPWSSRNFAFVSACQWARRRGLVGEQAVLSRLGASRRRAPAGDRLGAYHRSTRGLGKRATTALRRGERALKLCARWDEILRPLRPEDYDGLYAVAADPLIWEQQEAAPQLRVQSRWRR